LEQWINPGEDKNKVKIPAVIKDYDDMSKDTNVDFTITFVKGKLDELEKSKGDYGCNGLEKLLKLYTTNSTTNMHLFDEYDILQKYDSIPEIIDAYYDVRLELYQSRKDYMIEVLERELMLLTNKARYIKENLEGTIDLRKKKKDEVVDMLNEKDYDVIDDDEDFKYLTKMPMDSVTEENVERLYKERGNKNAELDKVKTTTIHKMWLDDLETLKSVYGEYKEDRARLMSGADSKPKKKTVVKKKTKGTNMILVEE
jgi:DNA topoisomerase-2